MNELLRARNEQPRVDIYQQWLLSLLTEQLFLPAFDYFFVCNRKRELFPALLQCLMAAHKNGKYSSSIGNLKRYLAV